MRQFSFSLLLVSLLIVPSLALAQAPAPDDACNKLNRDFQTITGGSAPETLSSKCSSTGETITWIIQVALLFSGTLAVLVLIYAGVRYITSAGSPEAHKNAKTALLYAVIGLLVVLLASAVVAVVSALVTK